MLCAVLFRGAETTPFANVLVENGRATVDEGVSRSLLLRRVASPDGIGFVTPEDGEAYVRALPWAITDPQVWADVFDPDDLPDDIAAVVDELPEFETTLEGEEGEPGDDFDPTEGEPGDDEEADIIEAEGFAELLAEAESRGSFGLSTVISPDGRIEIFHTPGGKPHNQKNHTRHGYIRKNTKLAGNVDAHIRKKDGVSAKPSNYAAKTAANYQGQADKAKQTAVEKAKSGDYSYGKDLADAANYEKFAKNALDQGKAKLGSSYYTDHGHGKLVAVGKQGTWGVVEIDSLPIKPVGGKATTRVGKKVIVDFEKVGIQNVAASKDGKSIGSERNKKEAAAAKKAKKENAEAQGVDTAKVKSSAPAAVQEKVAKAEAAEGSTLTNNQQAKNYKTLQQEETAEWNKKWDDHVQNKLTAGERGAIQSYTGSGYYGINGGTDDAGNTRKGLRVPPPSPSDQQKIKQLDSAMAKSRVDRDITVFRGTTFSGFNKLKPDDTFGDPGFLSTSTNKDSAFSGMHSFEMRIPKGSRAVYVSSISAVGKSERELLLPRDSKFRVVSVQNTSFYSSEKKHFVVELISD